MCVRGNILGWEGKWTRPLQKSYGNSGEWRPERNMLCIIGFVHGWILRHALACTVLPCLCHVGPVRLPKFLAKRYCSVFVVIWQILFNHGLIRLKRFVSSISSKLCNYIYFLSIFNASYMRPKIRCDGESWKFWHFGVQPNRAVVHCYAMPQKGEQKRCWLWNVLLWPCSLPKFGSPILAL
jgi:hypothetical protein